MATTTLTDQFTIMIDAIADNLVHDITTTRAFRIAGAQAIISGSVATSITISKVASGGAATILTSTADGGQGPAVIQSTTALSNTAELGVFGPNTTLLGSDNLRVQVNPGGPGVPTTAVEAVVLYCIGSPAATWATT